MKPDIKEVLKRGQKKICIEPQTYTEDFKINVESLKNKASLLMLRPNHKQTKKCVDLIKEFAKFSYPSENIEEHQVH